MTSASERSRPAAWRYLIVDTSIFRNLAQRIGIKVSATASETISAKEIVRDRSSKRRLARPSTKSMGRKTATVVRVPVYGGHSEAVNVELKKDFELEEVTELLAATPGITIMDDVKNNIYPMPLLAEGKDDVFVGRIRRDESIAYGLNLWVVSDNLRKGAATNAIQIAEYLVVNQFV